MAAKTPVTTPGTTDFNPPDTAVMGGTIATGVQLKNLGTRLANRSGLKLQIYFFDDIDDGDTWTSNIPNIFAVAWQPNQQDTHNVAPALTTQATGVITFNAENANSKGWLWVLRGM